MALHGLVTAPFWLARRRGAGLVLLPAAPRHPGGDRATFSACIGCCENKYYLDRINEVVFAGGARLLGRGLWKAATMALIDGLAVNGSAKLVGWLAACCPQPAVGLHLSLRLRDAGRRRRRAVLLPDLAVRLLSGADRPPANKKNAEHASLAESGRSGCRSCSANADPRHRPRPQRAAGAHASRWPAACSACW
jgi:hypothetical protein